MKKYLLVIFFGLVTNLAGAKAENVYGPPSLNDLAPAAGGEEQVGSPATLEGLPSLQDMEVKEIDFTTGQPSDPAPEPTDVNPVPVPTLSPVPEKTPGITPAAKAEKIEDDPAMPEGEFEEYTGELEKDDLNMTEQPKQIKPAKKQPEKKPVNIQAKPEPKRHSDKKRGIRKQRIEKPRIEKPKLN